MAIPRTHRNNNWFLSSSKNLQLSLQRSLFLREFNDLAVNKQTFTFSDNIHITFGYVGPVSFLPEVLEFFLCLWHPERVEVQKLVADEVVSMLGGTGSHLRTR